MARTWLALLETVAYQGYHMLLSELTRRRQFALEGRVVRQKEELTIS